MAEQRIPPSPIPASCALQPQVHPDVLWVFSQREFSLVSRHLGTVDFSTAIQLPCATTPGTNELVGSYFIHRVSSHFPGHVQRRYPQSCCAQKTGNVFRDPGDPEADL